MLRLKLNHVSKGGHRSGTNYADDISHEGEKGRFINESLDGISQSKLRRNRSNLEVNQDQSGMSLVLALEKNHHNGILLYSTQQLSGFILLYQPCFLKTGSKPHSKSSVR